MQTSWALQDAKNKLSKVVNAAYEGLPQVITKRGMPTVVVLSLSTYDRLLKHGKNPKPSFTDFLLSMPKDTNDKIEYKADILLREVEF